MMPVDLEKVDHGMPLFLFNNSDKKFHGIFERADDGKQKRFIQIRPKPNQQYQPLPLARLERMIYPNDLYLFDMPCVYYELHHIETEDLLALFQGEPPLYTMTRLRGTSRGPGQSGVNSFLHWRALKDGGRRNRRREEISVR